MEKHDDAGLELVLIASEWKMHISAATIYDRVAAQLVDTCYEPSRSQGGVCTPRTTRSPEEGRVMRCWTWNTTSCSITEPLHWNHPKLNGWQMTEMAYLGPDSNPVLIPIRQNLTWWWKIPTMSWICLPSNLEVKSSSLSVRIWHDDVKFSHQCISSDQMKSAH